VRSGPGEARTILLLHIISVRPSKQPLMVRTFLKVYMELGSYFLFLQEQIKDVIIIKALRSCVRYSSTHCVSRQTSSRRMSPSGALASIAFPPYPTHFLIAHKTAALSKQ
jgi:hypothetical protein